MSNDTNKSSTSNSPNELSRTCGKCEAEMTHLSDFQPGLGGTGLRVFRCYDCNHVVSEQMYGRPRAAISFAWVPSGHHSPDDVTDDCLKVRGWPAGSSGGFSLRCMALPT